MKRPPKKTVLPAPPPKSGEKERSLLDKGHHSEPATPKPMLKEAVGPFADDTWMSLEKKLASLSFTSLEDKAQGESSTATDGKEKGVESDAPADGAPADPVEEEDEDDEEDDGYLSDDPEERLDPVRAGEVAALAGFTLTLLIPHDWVKEVPRTIDTVKELIVYWKKALTPQAQTTTNFQILQPAYLSKKRFGRMQVTFRMAADANYVWRRRVEHFCVNNEKLILDWQHPENSLYLKERAQNPDAIEVLLKSVPEEISSDMVYKFLVKTPLEKHGHPPFQHGAAFHRMVDPVTGADTDKIKGGESAPKGYVSVVAHAEACEKVRGSSFAQALPHVRSVQHCTAILKGGGATRARWGKVNLIAIRKEFGL
ncbi:unnamed protein product [Closterium sp. Naga37s-1]|nr:unnamed protein product [Closterium sp. Naga37s-1]